MISQKNNITFLIVCIILIIVSIFVNVYYNYGDIEEKNKPYIFTLINIMLSASALCALYVLVKSK